MATSGSIQHDTAFGYVRLSWTTTGQNVSGNYSTVSYTLSIQRNENISSTASKAYSITINGVKVASGTTTIGGSGTKTIKTGTTTISHNSDGSKTFSLSFSQQIDITYSGTWIGTVTGSGTGTLNVIPRATTPTLSASSIDMGQTLTITMNRASASFTHTLTWKFNASVGTIGTNLGTSTTWTVPLAFANQIPNATSGTATLTCTTYNGTSVVGTKVVSFTVKVPSTVVPTLSATVTEATSGLAAKFGAFVQGNSTFKVVTTAAGAYSSTIQTYNVNIRNAAGDLILSYKGQDITTDPIPISGTVKVAVGVTDSRGRTASVSYDQTVVEYTPPQITAFSAARANANGTEQDDGDHVKFTIDAAISPVGNANDKTFKISYRQKGAETWTQIWSSTSAYTFDSTVTPTTVFNVDNGYDVKLEAIDYFTTVEATIDVATAFTLIDFRSTGRGVAFGKVSEADRMEISLDVDLTGEFLQEAKIAPTLQNGWVNFNEAYYESASYWKDKCGVVHLSGMIKGGTISAGTLLFVLPEGYRPRKQEAFATVSNNQFARVDVQSNGSVFLQYGGNATWLSLSGITFKTGV